MRLDRDKQRRVDYDHFWGDWHRWWLVLLRRCGEYINDLADGHGISRRLHLHGKPGRRDLLSDDVTIVSEPAVHGWTRTITVTATGCN
jgi:hypothetical protein